MGQKKIANYGRLIGIYDARRHHLLTVQRYGKLVKGPKLAFQHGPFWPEKS